MLPEVYLRWGARPWKVISKLSRLPQNGLGCALHSVWRRARRVW
jgi:hypothetical protein